VETLSNIPIIVTYEAYFMNIGPSGFYGPKLFPVSGKVKKPGVYEATMDITLTELIDMAGGVKNGKKVKAVFAGALGIYRADELDMPMDYSPKGFGGTGTTIVLDEDDCIVDALVVITNFFHHESCGKCTPCRIGTYEQHIILKKLKEGKATQKDLQYLKHLSQNIPANSICGLGFSAPNAVADALRKFPEEIQAHLDRTCKVCFKD